MNTEKDFQLRLDAYEFILDECIKYEEKIQSTTDKIEDALEGQNIGTAKKLSLTGLNCCGTLTKLYGKFSNEVDSFRDFLSEKKDTLDFGDVEQDFANLVSDQINENQESIKKCVMEHQKLFYHVMHDL